MRRDWSPPRRLAHDELVSATVTYTDGSTEVLVLLKRPTPGGGWTLMGYSRSLDLPLGSEVILHLDPPDPAA